MLVTILQIIGGILVMIIFGSLIIAVCILAEWGGVK